MTTHHQIAYMRCLLGMLSYLLGCWIASTAAAASSNSENTTWSDRLEYVGVAVTEPGYHVWGSSPVIGPSGKTHLFVSRWSTDAGFGGWLTDCEIARYVSDRPEGPFEFSEVIVKGSHTEDAWDRESPHNPTIQKVGDRYVLLYIANRGGPKPARVASQRIGMMVSNSLDGAWKKIGNQGLILSPPQDQAVWCYGTTVGVNNPALFAHPDGRFFLYYKAKTPGDVRRMGVAIADKLEGPYQFHNDPLTSNQNEIEDGYAFAENDEICLLTTNNHGGAGYLWKSPDGIHFDKPILGFGPIASYVPSDRLQKAKIFRGKKFERPQLLIQNAMPTHLYVATGVSLGELAGSCSCVFRINRQQE